MSTPSTIPAEHDTPPLTEARIAATLDRLSRLEQACVLLDSDSGMGWLYALVVPALVCLAGGAALLWAGVW